MNGDTFTGSNNINQQKRFNDENNFFLKRDTVNQYSSTDLIKHLNDYDSNILKNDAYKDINNDILKLEYKIAIEEENIKNIDKQILTAKEMLDFDQAEQLFIRRKQVQEKLRTLFDLYNDSSLSAKISGNLTTKFKNKFQQIIDIMKNFNSKISAFLPKQMTNFFEIKNSLATLESINKSVDELIALHIPYGESHDKYEQLSKYIVKANSIQAEIARHIK